MSSLNKLNIEIERLEKGCHKTNIKWAGKDDIVCHIKHLCPKCQAKLSALLLGKEAVEEVMEEKRLWKVTWLSEIEQIMDKFIESNFTERNIGWYSRDKILKELKQRLQSQQVVEQGEGSSTKTTSLSSADKTQETDGQGFGTVSSNAKSKDSDSVMGSEWSSSPVSNSKPRGKTTRWSIDYDRLNIRKGCRKITIQGKECGIPNKYGELVYCCKCRIKQELHNLEEADYLDKKRIAELKKQLEELDG